MKKLTPMVAMNRVSGDWPISGRSTPRSITIASTSSRISESGPARYQGRPSLSRPAKFSGGEEHDRALGVVEHPGRLEDDHEADRDQGVEEAVAEPGDQGLEQARRVGRHLGEGPDQVGLDDAHAGLRLSRG